MSRISATHLLLAGALAVFLAAFSLGSAEHAAAAPAAASQATVDARQANFKAILGAFRAVRGELEKDTPDYPLIAAKAKDISARAGKIGGLFPHGTSNANGFKTEALPAIWTNPAGFKAATKKLVDESAKLASVAAKRNKQAVAAQAMAMGGACKGCHDQFRLAAK